jgi:outer membrane lipoprotein-sorting protein
MRLADKLRRLFGGAAVTTDTANDEAVFTMIRTAYTKTVEEHAAQCGPRVWRLNMKNPIVKIAVAATIIILVGFGIRATMSGTPAFADVVKPILEAHTATFKMVWHKENEPVQTVDGEFMDPGLERQTIRASAESDQDEQVLVMDYVRGKVMALIPSRKSAMILEMENRSGDLDPEKLNQFEELRRRIRQVQENPDGTVQYLGEAEIDGRKALGYRFTNDGADSTIWADVETLLPLQIEHSLQKSGVKTGSVVMMDIQFNVPLDPAEFSMDVPSDYTLQTLSFDASEPREADFIETLRVWTDITHGVFPSRVDSLPGKEARAALGENQDIENAKDFNDPAIRDRMQLALKIIRGFMFVKSLSAKGIDWHYAGADAAFGDATEPIFWYLPTGAATYRVVYADLHAAEVVPENLPK